MKIAQLVVCLSLITAPMLAEAGNRGARPSKPAKTRSSKKTQNRARASTRRTSASHDALARKLRAKNQSMVKREQRYRQMPAVLAKSARDPLARELVRHVNGGKDTGDAAVEVMRLVKVGRVPRVLLLHRSGWYVDAAHGHKTREGQTRLTADVCEMYQLTPEKVRQAMQEAARAAIDGPGVARVMINRTR